MKAKTARRLRTNQVVVHRGAAAQAVKLLRYWAVDGTDEPFILEMMKQSRECANDLQASLRRGKS